jgi:hypothetical protein
VTPERQKIECLIKMAERLMAALAADIEDLKAGRPKHLRMIEPEMQKLSMIFSREADSLDPASARDTPADLKKKFFAVTAKFRDLLHLHMRYVTRVRNASEGIIKAVADDVERRRTAQRPYTPVKSSYRPPPSAMVYNNVV